MSKKREITSEDIINFKAPRTFGLHWVLYPIWPLLFILFGLFGIIPGAFPVIGIIGWLVAFAVVATVHTFTHKHQDDCWRYIATLHHQDIEHMLRQVPHDHPLADVMEYWWKKRKADEYRKSLITPRRPKDE